MKKIIFLLVNLLSSFIVFSQTHEKSLLWEISGNGLKEPSYIFGTIHISCEKDVVISPELKKALKKADQLYLEIDMDEPGLQLEMLQHMMMKDGVTLQKLISKEDFKLASTKFNEMSKGVKLSSLSSVKPMLLMAFMLPSMMDCKTTSWEEVIMANVKKQKKEIHGLETAAYQLAVFDSIPYQLQADELMKTVKGVNNDKKELDQLLQFYADKDIDGLYKSMNGSSDLMKDYENILLENRNKNWVAVIPTIISKNSTLFAVGAGHLAGTNGLLNLLVLQGFTVKPVMGK